ncbi:MAG: glycosyltransferase involved in cell wall biosynthesis [Polaribacter sp.]
MIKIKKLIFTVTNDLNYDQRMIRICSSLSKGGYEVLLVGRKKKDSLPLVDQHFAQKRLYCYFEKGKWFYLEYNFRLFFFLLFQKFDLVCGIDLDSLLPALWVARIKGKICVYDAHEYYTESPEIVNRGLIKKIWTAVAAISIPKVDGAYTVCQSLATIIGERYGKRFDLVRNMPFTIPPQKVVDVSDEKVLLYQGALNDGRGLPELITAMKSIDGVELWLAGEGDLSKALRQQVADLGLEKKVKFLGYILPAELKNYTKKAHIGLNLLENKGLSYYYSLANKAFDYIQSEKPAIHMDFPEYRALNEKYETSILLPDLSIENIIKAINTLVSDKKTYLRLRENTKAAKSIYNWEKEEKRLLNFYNKIFTK